MAEHRDVPGTTPEQPYTVHDDVDAAPAPSGRTTEPATDASAASAASGVPKPSEAHEAFDAPAASGPHGTLTAPPTPEAPDAAGSAGAPPRRSGGPDPVGLVAGVLALAVGVLALTDTLTAVDARWVLAAGAILVGIAVLAAASRPRTHPDR